MKRKIDSDKCYRSTVELIPNSQMAKELDRCMDYDRFCWNILWQMEKEYQEKNNGKRKKSDLSLKEYRKIRNNTEWQLKLPAYILAQVNNTLKATMSQIVEYNKGLVKSKSNKPFKKVQFKSKKNSKFSFIVPNDRFLKTKLFEPCGKNFYFGICLGDKSVVDSRYRLMKITELPQGLKNKSGRILSATIFKKYGRYYVSFCMEKLKVKRYKKAVRKNIGIDPGLKTTLTLSNGVKISYPKKIKKLISKAEYYQSRMDKRYDKNKKIQSKRYYSARTKFWRTLKRITNLKKDWIHKVTTKLAKAYHTIKFEDIQINNMLKSKRNLAKALGESSLGYIKKILNQKLILRNGVLILVPCQAASTQTCSKCGYVRKGEEKLTLSDRIFTCPHCGHIEDRDINAAKNIAKY